MFVGPRTSKGTRTSGVHEQFCSLRFDSDVSTQNTQRQTKSALTHTSRTRSSPVPHAGVGDLDRRRAGVEPGQVRQHRGAHEARPGTAERTHPAALEAEQSGTIRRKCFCSQELSRVCMCVCVCCPALYCQAILVT